MSEFDKLKDEAAKLAQEHPKQVKQGEQVGGEGRHEASRE
jgi:hypothetical protein